MFRRKHHKHHPPAVRTDSLAVRIKLDIERQREYRQLCEQLRRDWLRAH